MADALKAEGNKAFSAKDYPTAMYVELNVHQLWINIITNKQYSDKFTQAITLDPNNEVLYSNRSAVYAAHSEYQKALDDANKAIDIKSNWSKGYLRKGAASRGLGDLREYFGYPFFF